MPTSITFVILIFELLLVADIIQGQRCRRTNPDRAKVCSDECFLVRGCSSDRKECTCDGDCGYSCIKKGLTCKKPRNPTNGRRVINGRKFNDTASFTCDPGFTLYGSSVRTCRGKGVWDGIETICGKNCTDPGIGNNTLRSEPFTNEEFKTSQVLHYHCEAGYHIEGKDSIICGTDGLWDSRSPPQCYRTACSPPNLPNNSVVHSPSWFNISQGAKNGRKLFLRCDPGYDKVGTSQLWTCLNGQWKQPVSFKCLPKSCGDPGVPRNGRKIGFIYHFKSKVTFHCDPCYKLIGASYRVCNADQSWSDQQPFCQKVQTQCKAIASISNGKVSLASRECGGKAEFSCDKGHNLIGSRQIFCNKDGQWSGIIPHCEPVSCIKFNTSDKVNVVVSGEYRYGSTAKFSCKADDYILNDNDAISCKENGEWSDKIPECLAPCHVEPSNNLTSVKSVYKHGEAAQLDCQPGFTLLGVIKDKMPRCFDGKWGLLRRFPYCVGEKVIKKQRQTYRQYLNSLAKKLLTLG